MENAIVQFDDTAATMNQSVQCQVSELDELHLMLVGGGCAEVCPY